MQTIKRPTEEKLLMYSAVLRELKKRSSGTLTDEEMSLITAEFVHQFDFSNSALMHKSSGGWAKLILSELEKQEWKNQRVETI